MLPAKQKYTITQSTEVLRFLIGESWLHILKVTWKAKHMRPSEAARVLTKEKKSQS